MCFGWIYSIIGLFKVTLNYGTGEKIVIIKFSFQIPLTLRLIKSHYMMQIDEQHKVSDTKYLFICFWYEIELFRSKDTTNESAKPFIPENGVDVLLDLSQVLGNRHRQQHKHVLVFIDFLDKVVQHKQPVNQTDPKHYKNPYHQVIKQNYLKLHHQFLLLLQNQHRQVLMRSRNHRKGHIIIVGKVLLEVRLLSPHSDISENQQSAILRQQWQITRVTHLHLPIANVLHKHARKRLMESRNLAECLVVHIKVLPVVFQVTVRQSSLRRALVQNRSLHLPDPAVECIVGFWGQRHVRDRVVHELQRCVGLEKRLHEERLRQQWNQQYLNVNALAQFYQLEPLLLRKRWTVCLLVVILIVQVHLARSVFDVKRDEELFCFGGEFLDLLLSDAEEDLESVDFFLVDFGNDAGQDKAEEDEGNDASDKHDNLGFHIVGDKL